MAVALRSAFLWERHDQEKQATPGMVGSALYTHRPSLLPIEWLNEAFKLARRDEQRPRRAVKFVKLGHLEEVKVVTSPRPTIHKVACTWPVCLVDEGDGCGNHFDQHSDKAVIKPSRLPPSTCICGQSGELLNPYSEPSLATTFPAALKLMRSLTTTVDVRRVHLSESVSHWARL